jgi:hypothetical protein
MSLSRITYDAPTINGRLEQWRRHREQTLWSRDIDRRWRRESNGRLLTLCLVVLGAQFVLLSLIQAIQWALK